MKTTINSKALEQFLESYEARGSNTTATVITALVLPKTEQESVSNIIQGQLGKEFPITYKVNPEIIGGLRVEIGDWVYDGTLARELNVLVTTLTT